MSFTLPDLPYPKDALAPHISSETLDYHYGKHHKSYVDKLNTLVAGTPFEGKSLEDIVKTAEGGIFNNAAQIWNHTFYWNSLSPDGGNEPTGKIATAVAESFGSFENFKKEFTDSAAGNFGSGWTWLVQRSDGSLASAGTSPRRVARSTMDVATSRSYSASSTARSDSDQYSGLPRMRQLKCRGGNVRACHCQSGNICSKLRCQCR